MTRTESMCQSPGLDRWAGLRRVGGRSFLMPVGGASSRQWAGLCQAAGRSRQTLQAPTLVPVPASSMSVIGPQDSTCSDP